MSVRRVTTGPCWEVDAGAEWVAHQADRAEAIVTAGDVLPDAGPIPVVSRARDWCWQLVWPCCGEFLDDEEYGPETHYSLEAAEELDRQLGGHQLCPVCSIAALYGSVAAADGSILPDLPAAAAPVPRRSPDQLALPLPGPRAAEMTG